MNHVKNYEGNAKMYRMLETLGLAGFNSTYSSLTTLLARRRRSTGITQVFFTTPPGQTTIPEDPNRSGGSSSSTESKPEIYAQNVANRLLEATHSTVAEWMEDIGWINSEVKLHLSSQYIRLLFF
jgi:hypothetical protein